MASNEPDYSGFTFLALAADDPEPPPKSLHPSYDNDEDENITPETTAYWVDDSLCQENLPAIITLTPDETTIDSTNHIHSDDIHLFFEELGYLTEEPEPLDPKRDYLAEYHEKLELQQQLYKKSRRHHIDLDRIPSLLDDNETNSPSGVSSSSSSFIHHPQQQLQSTLRSPYFLGAVEEYDPPQPYVYGTATGWNHHLHHPIHH